MGKRGGRRSVPFPKYKQFGRDVSRWEKRNLRGALEELVGRENEPLDSRMNK